MCDTVQAAACTAGFANLDQATSKRHNTCCNDSIFVQLGEQNARFRERLLLASAQLAGLTLI